jgi:hypothetical protein
MPEILSSKDKKILQRKSGGSEKDVYSHPSKENKIYSFLKENYPTVNQIKGRYYLTKILHILFLKNIPDIYAVVKNNNAIIVTERKFVNDNFNLKNHSKKQYRFYARSIKSDSKFQRFVSALKNFGIYPDVSNMENFAYVNDEIVYLDNSFLPWKIDKIKKSIRVLYDYNKIKETIELLSEPSDKRRALLYLRRLEELRAQEMKLFTNG